MANLKASIIDVRKSRKREAANRKVRSEIKTYSKKVDVAIKNGDEKATELCSRYAAVLDKAAKRNIIHKNKANRLKSKTSQLLHSAGSEKA